MPLLPRRCKGWGMVVVVMCCWHQQSLMSLFLSHTFPVFQSGLLNGLQFLSERSQVPQCSSPLLAVWKYLLHLGPVHRLTGNVWSACWSTSFISFFLHLCIHLALLHIFAFTLHCHAVFFPFLNPCHHLHRGAQLCPVMDLLEIAGASCVQPWSLLTEATPAAPACWCLDACTWCSFTVLHVPLANTSCQFYQLLYCYNWKTLTVFLVFHADMVHKTKG